MLRARLAQPGFGPWRNEKGYRYPKRPLNELEFLSANTSGAKAKTSDSWSVKSLKPWRLPWLVSGTGVADAFSLKRPDRCPARILRVYDPRGSAGIVTVDTREGRTCCGIRSPSGICGMARGWKTKAVFSRYNVMNTARTRAAMIQGGEFVAGRIRNAGHT